MRWVFLILTLSACGSKPSMTMEGDLARCLSEKGVKMYGAFWCPHCAAQKSLFSDAADELPYVECSNQDRTQTPVCKDQRIVSYPTWIFPGGERAEGEQTLEALRTKSGC